MSDRDSGSEHGGGDVAAEGDCFKCSHNHWDNIRVKKGVVTLACRYCRGKWKLRHPIPDKCPDFYRGFCPFGAHCPYLHIHRFKSKAKSPDPSNYHPQIERDEDFAAVAKTVFERHGQHVSPTNLYEEVIVAYAEHQFKSGQLPNTTTPENLLLTPSSDLGLAPISTAGTANSPGISPTNAHNDINNQPPADPFHSNNNGGGGGGAGGIDDFGLTVEIPAQGQPVSGGLRFGTPGSSGHFAETPDTPITRRFVPQMREMDKTPPAAGDGGDQPANGAGFTSMKGLSAVSPGVPPDVWRYQTGTTPTMHPQHSPNPTH